MNFFVFLLLSFCCLPFVRSGSHLATHEDEAFDAGTGSFLVHMEKLKVTNNTQLHIQSSHTIVNENDKLSKECRERTFAFTLYYRMVYLKYCSDSVTDFNNFCGKISNYTTDGSNDDAMLSDIKMLGFQGKVFTSENVEDYDVMEAERSCLEINTFEGRNESAPIDTQYTEWFILSIPFCRPFVSGISRNDYDKISTMEPVHSALHIMSSQCQAAVYATMILDGIIAALIIIANLVILFVIIKSPFMKTIPGLYKSSLAVADLLIGCVVLPGSIHNTKVMYTEQLPFRVQGQQPSPLDYFSQTYLNAMGFFTILSFCASVFSLLGMTTERYRAISSKYLNFNNRRKLKNGIAVGCLWAAAILISLYPILDPNPSTDYTISALNLVLSTGIIAQALYLIFLGIAIIALWGLNMTIFCLLKRTKAKHIQSPVVKSQRNYPLQRKTSSASEHSLTKTIIIIVVAFTAAIMPTIIAIFAVFSPNVRVHSNPANYSPSAGQALSGFEYIASRLFMSNSFWNCIIYNIHDKKFRTALLSSFCRRRRGVLYRQSEGTVSTVLTSSVAISYNNDDVDAS